MIHPFSPFHNLALDEPRLDTLPVAMLPAPETARLQFRSGALTKLPAPMQAAFLKAAEAQLDALLVQALSGTLDYTLLNRAAGQLAQETARLMQVHLGTKPRFTPPSAPQPAITQTAADRGAILARLVKRVTGIELAETPTTGTAIHADTWRFSLRTDNKSLAIARRMPGRTARWYESPQEFGWNDGTEAKEWMEFLEAEYEKATAVHAKQQRFMKGK